MLIIAGLGNPSLRYRHTRHNVGFDALDVIAKKCGISVKTKAHMALIGRGKISGQDVLLVKPQTYMNRSGESLRSVVKTYAADPTQDLLVLVDDISLPPGVIRIRKKGSAGGHNGLKNIIALCETEEFPRIRIGVGGVSQESDLIRHVLSRPKGEDAKHIRNACEITAEIIEQLVKRDLEYVMNEYNGKHF